MFMNIAEILKLQKDIEIYFNYPLMNISKSLLLDNPDETKCNRVN